MRIKNSVSFAVRTFCEPKIHQKKKSLCYSTITSESKPANYLRTMPPGLNEYFVRLLYPVCVCVWEQNFLAFNRKGSSESTHTNRAKKKKWNIMKQNTKMTFKSYSWTAQKPNRVQSTQTNAYKCIWKSTLIPVSMTRQTTHMKLKEQQHYNRNTHYSSYSSVRVLNTPYVLLW